MRYPDSRLVALVLLLALAASACTGSSTASTTTEAPSSSTTAQDTTTSTTVAEGPEAALRAQIDELTSVTEDLRELEFLEPPTVTLVTDDELADRVRLQIEEEFDPADLPRDTAVMVLLGLIEPDTDLFALYSDLLSEQVIGYYDSDAEEMVIPAGQELSALQKSTLVHELTHALTDQHFAFADRMEELDEADRFDELSALQAVVEGDASFTELLYVSELPTEEQVEMIRESLDQDTSVFDQTPRFIQELLFFPYLTGSEFVQELWGSDTGFDRVNDAYLEPPASTEQIYHPNAYLGGEDGLAVELPDLLLPGYEVEEEAVWGEVSFQVMFQQGLGASEANEAAAGWGGDEYQVFWDGENVAFVLLYEGDTIGDAIEMHDALASFAGSEMDVGEATTTAEGTEFNGNDYAYLARFDTQVLFVATSDATVGPGLVTALISF